jgi:hypothetical protein
MEQQREEIYSKSVRAGRRTYFFDVKKNKNGFHYLTITESKKKSKDDGQTFYYEKSKVFLYREDFTKFFEGLKDVVEFMDVNYPEPEREANDDFIDNDSTNQDDFLAGL